MRRILALSILMAFMFFPMMKKDTFSCTRDHAKKFTICNDTNSKVSIRVIYHSSIFFLRPDKQDLIMKTKKIRQITYYKEDLIRNKFIQVNGGEKIKVQSGKIYYLSKIL